MLKKSLQLFLIFIVCGNLNLVSAEPKLEIIAAWKNMAFAFDSIEQEYSLLENGYYKPDVPKKPYDADIYVTDDGVWRKFVSIPRVASGIPYTLAELVNDVETERGPLLRAYPNTEMHLNRSCDGLFSVLRVLVETDCHRLWVIDSGRDLKPPPSYGPKTQVCPPKLLAFDLKTDTILYSYEIPKSHYNTESIFNGVILHPTSTCEHTKGFVTDTRGTGLIVFERMNDNFKSWRTYSKYFNADPAYFFGTIANETFEFHDGLYTIAPSLKNELIYFHPYASVTEYAMPLKLADYEEIWKHDLNLDFLIKNIGQRRTQSTTQILDSQGNLWFTLFDPLLGLYCWNTNTTYDESNFKLVIENSEVFQFVVGLKIHNLPGTGETIVGISNRKQKDNAGTIDINEINFRMFLIPIEGIIC